MAISWLMPPLTWSNLGLDLDLVKVSISGGEGEGEGDEEGGGVSGPQLAIPSVRGTGGRQPS